MSVSFIYIYIYIADRGPEDKRTGLHIISAWKHLGYLIFYFLKFIPIQATRTYTYTCVRIRKRATCIE
jgi:hypothetical protein